MPYVRRWYFVVTGFVVAPVMALPVSFGCGACLSSQAGLVRRLLGAVRASHHALAWAGRGSGGCGCGMALLAWPCL